MQSVDSTYFLTFTEVKKRIVISVSNDLDTDQRVQKQCRFLYKSGFEIALYGRKLKDSKPIERPYFTQRFNLLFNHGFLFYAALNTRLFLALLFSKADAYYANDLDTLPANYLASLLRRKPLIYDSHEFFTEVPEVQNRPLVKSVWKFFERICIRQCDLVLTVSQSIAELLQGTYKLDKVFLVRNVPYERLQINPVSKSEIGVAEDQFLLLLQGTGINIDRGAEELIEAITFLDNTLLLIIGGGNAMSILKAKVDKLNLNEKVLFKDKMPFGQMIRYTAAADLGLSLDKNTNINYKFSLPNKLFDYALAGIPVLTSNLHEVRKIVEGYNIGEVIDSHDPQMIAQKLESLRSNKSQLAVYRKNTSTLLNELMWEEEYRPVLQKIQEIV